MARLTYKNGFNKWAFLIVGREFTGNAADKLAEYENMGALEDFAPIKRGSMTSVGMEEVWCEWFKCSECGCNDLYEGANFCPNCGAVILKSCPYCGNTNVKLKADYMGEKVRYYIDCEVYACNRVEVQYYDTPKEAIEAWNRIERTAANET